MRTLRSVLTPTTSFFYKYAAESSIRWHCMYGVCVVGGAGGGRPYLDNVIFAHGLQGKDLTRVDVSYLHHLDIRSRALGGS
eukprot:COSAG02_NODE_205_length_29157_cov_13.424771_7_plen_81_part_00